ncbi:unnamed protein product [Sympodiomycopsis kandeliae]
MGPSPTTSDNGFSDALDGSEQHIATEESSNVADETSDPATSELRKSTSSVSRSSSSSTSTAPQGAKSQSDADSDQQQAATSPAGSVSNTPTKAKSTERKGPGVAALMARFQKTSSTSSISSASEGKKHQHSSSQEAPNGDENTQAKDDLHASGLLSEPETSSLAIDETKIPPSEGAVSLLDPATTIENPFRTSDTGTPSDETQRNSRSSFAVLPSAGDTNGDGPEPSSSRSSLPRGPSPDVSSGIRAPTSPQSTARFSEISLSSGVAHSHWADQGSSDNGLDSKRTTMVAFGEKDTLASQLEEVEEAKRMSSHIHERGMPRPNSEGMEKLRENFERMHQEQKRHSHARKHSNAPDSTNPEFTPSSPVPEEGADQVQADDSTDTQIPDGGDGHIEEVDWDFWGRVMSNYQEVAQQNPRDLSRAIQAGIPEQLRGLCWQLLSASKDEEMEIIYAYNIRQSSSHEKQIRKDLNRTFPEQEYFKDGKGIGQENLFNVVKAYSLYDEECGYCQGMQFIVGPLLMHMPDEEAFSTLVRLMKSYGLRGHFVPNMPGLQLRLFQFDRLLEDLLPLLHRHLTRQGIKASMYASQWFMTLFSYRFPLEFVYRILDSVFAEGLEAVFRFAVSLMKKSEDTLIQLSFEHAVAYLKGQQVVDVYKSEAGTYDVDAFARDAFSVQVAPYMLDAYANEFEDSVKAANAHRREVEALRLVNRNLAARVASLEEQLEKTSVDHVALANKALRSKLEKEEMEEELIRYKMLFAEASLRADQAGESTRMSQVSKTKTEAESGS